MLFGVANEALKHNVNIEDRKEAIIKANGGDRSIEPLISSGVNGNGIQGEKRGGSDSNDSFMTGTITITKKLLARRRSRPKF